MLDGKEGALKQTKSIKTAAGKLQIEADRLVLVSAGKVAYLDLDGDADREVELKVPAISAGAVRTVGTERIVYFGQDRKIRSLDLSGKELWVTDSPQEKPGGGVYSLFY